VIEVEETLFRGHPDVVDADLADYFGSIPHAELMRSLARRVVDRRVLHLVKMWLECSVEETDERGRKTRSTEAKDQRCGIPQGSPISPLLANLYMRRFVLGWKKLGLEQSLGARIVTYADDLVILCRRGKAEEALTRMRELMSKLKLTVNEEKTRICRSRKGSSTSWATRLGGCTRRRPARPIWATGHQRRASGAWSKRSMRSPPTR
jgi:RNA-directed DNA polymerase